MADDYDYDGDEMMAFDDDWIYVEDEFALAVRMDPSLVLCTADSAALF